MPTDSPPDGFTSARILVVDDQEANVRLLEGLLETWGYSQVRTTRDSSEVLGLVAQWRPDLLMLDLQMPPPDGFRLMEELARTQRGPVRLPMIALTADISPEAKRRALALGAAEFLTKPFDADEVRLRVANLLETRRLELELASQNETLEQRVRARTRDLERTRLEILDRLAVAAEYRDDDTHQHAQRVGRTAALLADALGLGPEEVQLIQRAAPLHDIGKIAIPDSILLKPGRLTAVEFETMKGHTLAGSRILGTSTSRLLQAAEEIAYSHHERWDGHGYPAGRAGEDIPVTGRLVTVADVFDALTHDRPYKVAVPIDQAISEIRALSGASFDPRVVRAFEALDHEALLAPVTGSQVLVEAPAARP